MAKKGRITAKKSFLEHSVGFGIILIFLVLPLLYFPGRAASYVTSKQYFLIGIVDLLTIGWVWLLCNDSRYRLTKKTLLGLLPLALFLLALTVSAVTGVSPASSFFSTVESGTGLILLYHVLLLAGMIASFVQVQQKSFIKSIMQATLFASVVLAIATFYTGVHGVIDINSTMLDGSSGGAMMGNSLLVGAYFIFSAFFTIWLIVQEQSVYKKILYGIGLAVVVLSPIYFNATVWKGIAWSQLLHSGYLFFGEARVAAGALGLGLFLSVCIWLLLKKHKPVLRTVGIVGLVLVMLGAAIVIEQTVATNSSVHQFFVAQAGNRTIDWQESLQGIKARPLLGWGPENFHVVYQQYLNPVIFSPGHGNEVWALHPHNNSLEVLISAGIIAFVLYVFMIVSLFIDINALRKKNIIDNKTFALLIGMLIAFILQQQMIYDSIVSYTMFFFIIALVAGLSTADAEPAKSVALSRNAKYLIGTGIAVIMLPIWVYAAYLPAQKMNEFQTVADAHSDTRVGMYQHLFHSPGSYTIDTDAEFYVGPLFYSYAGEQVQIKNNPLYQKVASQELQSLFAAVQPVWQHNLYDYHLTLSLLQTENLYYYLTGDSKALVQADNYAQRALMLSPTDPQLYVNYAQTLLYEKHNDQAKIMNDKALSLSPDYQPAKDFQFLLQSLKQ
jgi:O-antigen ligase